MDFRIADTFTDSLGRLTGEEQKAVKTTAFDLQLDPSSAGLQFHELDRARDRNFWSVRVSRDIRLIVHRTSGNLLLCYVGHHDGAYAWAERRKLETHPSTGAAQFVEIRETVRDIVVPRYVDAPEGIALEIGPGVVFRDSPGARPLFTHRTDGELLAYGVPAEWLADVRKATEDTLLDIAPHLPAEAAEALLALATGSTPHVVRWAGPESESFEHPDAKRRFRSIADAGELAAALEYPWEKWTIFLHPAQRESVERDYAGPARISGSAGTGKTIVALHRAVQLARSDPEARILLTTFSDALANALRIPLRRLLSSQPRLGERIDLAAIDAVAHRLYELNIGPPAIASAGTIRESIQAARQSGGSKFSPDFLIAEWETGRRPFDHVVADEAQDFDVPQLRFLAALAGERANGLFFTGDPGQRIFQQPFSWKALGVNIAGRSRTLRVNYRTSHQIRSRADRLLAPETSDIDGNTDDRRAVSVFNGTEPSVDVLSTEAAEIERVASWLKERASEGLKPDEIAVFVRSADQLERARAAVEGAGLESNILDERVHTASGRVTISTMHLAKGLEFRAVAVMACDDEVLPLAERIESVSEDSDLEEVYNTERHLLYVACTRARDHLLVTAVAPASEFLDDLGSEPVRSG